MALFAEMGRVEKWDGRVEPMFCVGRARFSVSKCRLGMMRSEWMGGQVGPRQQTGGSLCPFCNEHAAQRMATTVRVPQQLPAPSFTVTLVVQRQRHHRPRRLHRQLCLLHGLVPLPCLTAHRRSLTLSFHSPPVHAHVAPECGWPAGIARRSCVASDGDCLSLWRHSAEAIGQVPKEFWS